jgi:hypothetical protein
MATIGEVRQALADLLKTSLEMTYAHAYWPGTVMPLTVAVIPQPGRDYVSFEDATFCRPVWALSAVIIGPSTNLPVAMEWLDDAIARAPAAVDADPRLGGRVSNLVVEAVTEPGRITETASNWLMAVELRFRPFFLA